MSIMVFMVAVVLGVVKKRKTPGAIKVYYRLSNFEAGISKKKIPNATKQHCLKKLY